jgi:lambda repressor-like predicted transcriptional regulator
MAKVERPKFLPHIEFQLERIQNQADATAWIQLKPLLAPSKHAHGILMAQRNPYLPSLPLPKQPQQILIIIRGYARTLYISEGNMYEAGPLIEAQLRALMHRIVTRVMRTVYALQTDGLSFEYHGVTDRKMRTAIRSEVQEMINSRLRPRVERSPPPPPLEIRGNATESPLLKMAKMAAEHAAQTKTQVLNARQAFVNPRLTEKGWSILDWANDSDVAYHTAADYLSGLKRPYPSTRLKLAKSLGISIQQLPR